MIPAIAEEQKLPEGGVSAVVRLLDGGATVPFIARYRKEATGGLDEVQIRTIEERKAYLAELEERRETILNSIQESGKLTLELKAKIRAADTKTELEDLYLPYKPKRRTRATIAREKGLEPLAERILAQPLEATPLEDAAGYVDEEQEVCSPEEALKWAREIVAERVVEDADVRRRLRNIMWEKGLLVTGVVEENPKQRTKFEDYYDHREPVAKVPSHRYLAIRRGESEGVLRVSVVYDDESFKADVEDHFGLNTESAYSHELRTAIADGVKRRLAPSVETDVRVDLKMRSDRAAVDIFAQNLENLLLAAPFGGRTVVGIDPGLRTGCKCAALDGTGKYLETITIFPARGGDAQDKAQRKLAVFLKKHSPAAVAVGNGTGGRETEALAKRVVKKNPSLEGALVVSVSEAGASVYSASDVAREEFSDLDLTVRGAISIGRRLQDPLAELVKIDPKSIGVGQYQHDVHQPLLQTKLHQVVESCVNRVGVELNTASASLLSYVAGVGPSLAKKIITHRQTQGAFDTRNALLKVKGLGPKTFEQAAGFLRVFSSPQLLDRSAVHPERYPLVEKMAKDMGVKLDRLVGNSELASQIVLERYLGKGVGAPTLRDIIAELGKPGRDPRKSFEAPSFREDVTEMEDLEPGMTIEGVVTNVTAFGAFVDVGVHQDGLVHVSQLADRFVKDPNEVVKVGDKLKVKVMDVDLERRRISLTARSRGEGQTGGKVNKNKGMSDKQRGGKRQKVEGGRGSRGPQKKFSNNPFASLLKGDVSPK